MIKTASYISVLLFCCIMAVLPSCKHTKDDLDSPPLNIIECQPAIDSMKQWYFFRPGSWWVYQEETSGALDTIRAISYDDSPSAGGYTQIVTQAKSALDGYTYEYYFNDSWTRHSAQSSYCLHFQIGIAKYIPGNLEGEAFQFFYPFSFGDFIYVTNYYSNLARGKSFLSHFYSDFPINQTDTIHNAYTFSVDYDIVNRCRHSEYTWARRVGLVRKQHVLQDSSSVVWNLIDYHVVN